MLRRLLKLIADAVLALAWTKDDVAAYHDSRRIVATMARLAELRIAALMAVREHTGTTLIALKGTHQGMTVALHFDASTPREAWLEVAAWVEKTEALWQRIAAEGLDAVMKDAPSRGDVTPSGGLGMPLGDEPTARPPGPAGSPEDSAEG